MATSPKNDPKNDPKMDEPLEEKGSGSEKSGLSDEGTQEQFHHEDKQVDASCHVPLSKSRVFFLNISWFGMNVMYLILSVEVVPSQVYALVGSEKKGQVLGGMVAAGAVVTFFISPLVGMKSDRLVSQYGKRRPLMLGGTVLLCIALFGMAFSAPDIESDISNVTCSIDLKLRRCVPYVNLTVLEQSQNNWTSESDEGFLLSLLMQKEDSRGNIGLYIAFYLCVMACYSIMSVPYNGLIADLTPPFQRENWSCWHIFIDSCPVLHLCASYSSIMSRASNSCNPQGS